MASARRADRLAVWVAVLSGVATLCAVGALAFSYLSQASEIRTAARNSCELFRFVVLAATPAGKQTQALKFIASTPLADCRAYADNPISVQQLEHRLEQHGK